MPAIPKTRWFRKSRSGFTLIELLVVIGIIGILASLLMPSLSGAKAQANKIKCMNNVRQLALSLIMYADDFEGQVPRRSGSYEDNWIVKLKPYYQVDKIVKCPSDEWRAHHSYLINGFNDYFSENLSDAEFEQYKQWQWPSGMRLRDIRDPSQTILFGEKRKGSFHVHMDLYQGEGNDIEEVAQARHRSSGNSEEGRGGGSNYSFADGSARFIKYPQALNPFNLWAVTDKWREGVPLDKYEE